MTNVTKLPQKYYISACLPQLSHIDCFYEIAKSYIFTNFLIFPLPPNRHFNPASCITW